MASKPVLIQMLVFYSGDHEDGAKSALIALHNCCRHPSFRDVCLNEHKYPITIFDSLVKTAISKFSTTLEKE
jgi:hypothetical protein